MQYAAIVEECLQFGQGYAAHKEVFYKFVPFGNEAEMKRWVEISELTKCATNYRIIQFDVVKVTKTVDVSVDAHN